MKTDDESRAYVADDAEQQWEAAGQVDGNAHNDQGDGDDTTVVTTQRTCWTGHEGRQDPPEPVLTRLTNTAPAVAQVVFPPDAPEGRWLRPPSARI